MSIIIPPCMKCGSGEVTITFCIDRHYPDFQRKSYRYGGTEHFDAKCSVCRYIFRLDVLEGTPPTLTTINGDQA